MRLGRYLAFLGPGLIAANAGNDAGGIATYASAGSQFGYRTLFFMLLVTVGLVVVQEMSVRLGAFSGQGLAALVRENFSPRLATFAIGCFLLANLGLVVSEFAGIGAALELFGLTRYVTIPMAAVAIWCLITLASYRYAERIFLVLTLAFFAYPAAAILGHPDWKLVATQTLWPHFLASRDFMLLGVALIGTTITPYMQLYASSAVADKGVRADQYPAQRLDAVGGAIFADLISFFIIVATAATIGGSGALESAGQAAEALRPVAGPAAEALFGLGLLGASALAATVVPLSTAYALAEAAGTERSVSNTFSEAPLFLGLFTAQIVLGAAVALTPVNLIHLLIGAQVLNGLLTPIVLSFLLALANRPSVLGDAANTPRFRAVATVAVLLVTTMAAIVVIQTVLEWFT